MGPIYDDQNDQKARFAGPEKPTGHPQATEPTKGTDAAFPKPAAPVTGRQAPDKPKAAAPKDDKSKATEKPEDTKRDETKDDLREARKLLRRYMEDHGGFRTLHVTTHEGSKEVPEFGRCDCDLCHEAAKIAGEPSQPHHA